MTPELSQLGCPPTGTRTSAPSHPTPHPVLLRGCGLGEEIVSAGAQDSFEVFIWSMQTGRLLDAKGHKSLGGARVQEGA